MPSPDSLKHPFTRAWPLAFAVPVVVAFVAYHLAPSQYHCDDRTWLSVTGAGFVEGLASPHPFHHFRPTFFVWLSAWQAMTTASPMVLGLAGVALQLVLVGLAFTLLRTWLSVRSSAVGGTLMAIHPVRDPHWFWASSQIDALCLVFVISSLIAATRAKRPGASRFWWVAVAVCTLCASFAKETALLTPLAILALPTTGDFRTRLRAFACSALGALLALIAVVLVLDGGGRGINMLVPREMIRGAIRFPLQILLPLDWSIVAPHLQDIFGLRNVWRISGLISIGIGIGIAWSLWSKRTHPWAHVSAIFFTWAATIWLVSETDRSLGVGALGVATWVAGVTELWRRDREVLALLASIVVAWTPLWGTSFEQWLGADAETRVFTEALAAQQESAPRETYFVTIGLPWAVGDQREPCMQPALEANDNASNTLSVFGARAADPSYSVTRTATGHRLRATPPYDFGSCAMDFRVDGAVFDDSVITRRSCDSEGHLREVDVNVEALVTAIKLQRHTDVVVMHWTGTGLTRLSE